MLIDPDTMSSLSPHYPKSGPFSTSDILHFFLQGRKVAILEPNRVAAASKTVEKTEWLLPEINTQFLRYSMETKFICKLYDSQPAFFYFSQDLKYFTAIFS